MAGPSVRASPNLAPPASCICRTRRSWGWRRQRTEKGQTSKNDSDKLDNDKPKDSDGSAGLGAAAATSSSAAGSGAAGSSCSSSAGFGAAGSACSCRSHLHHRHCSGQPAQRQSLPPVALRPGAAKRKSKRKMTRTRASPLSTLAAATLCAPEAPRLQPPKMIEKGSVKRTKR